MVVNIYGSMKVEIDNAVSQVDIPLANTRKIRCAGSLPEKPLLGVIDLHRGMRGHFI